MANKRNNQQQGRQWSGGRSRQSNSNPETQRIMGVAGRAANYIVAGDFESLDEMTRLAPGSGSIGGGSNSPLQTLSKSGSLQKGKIMASSDGTAVVPFRSNGKLVGCMIAEVSGRYITDLHIATF